MFLRTNVEAGIQFVQEQLRHTQLTVLITQDTLEFMRNKFKLESDFELVVSQQSFIGVSQSESSSSQYK
jgi:hypothetical protein